MHLLYLYSTVSYEARIVLCLRREMERTRQIIGLSAKEDPWQSIGLAFPQYRPLASTYFFLHEVPNFFF